MMEFDEIFENNIMKNARLPKIIILLQFVVVITSNFASVLTVRNSFPKIPSFYKFSFF